MPHNAMQQTQAIRPLPRDSAWVRPDNGSDNGPCIRFDDLTLGYNKHPAVHHLDGSIACGESLAIIGPNGSGKSTLIRCIAGLMRPMGGACHVRPGLRIAWLPQASEIDRSFPARLRDLVALGLWPRRGLLGRHRAADRQAVAQAIRAVGLDGFAARPLDSLSGGQFQRARFARVLVQDADLILLDEPFNAIDSRTVDDLLALIRRWHDEGRTVITVAHDLDLVRAHFPRTLLLAREAVAWGPTDHVITAANLARARRFPAAWDESAPWCEPDLRPDPESRGITPLQAREYGQATGTGKDVA